MHIDEAPNLSSQTATLLNSMAVCNIHLGKFELAESELMDAIQKNNKNGDTIANMIVVALHRGKSEDIIKRYFKCVLRLPHISTSDVLIFSLSLLGIDNWNKWRRVTAGCWRTRRRSTALSATRIAMPSLSESLCATIVDSIDSIDSLCGALVRRRRQRGKVVVDERAGGANVVDKRKPGDDGNVI